MTTPESGERFLLIFDPSRWSAARRFWYLLGAPFEASGAVLAGIQSASGHLDRCSILATLANRIIPHLAVEETELTQHGFSRAQPSRELAALFESMFNELYSSLDGVRSLLHSLFPKVQGVPSKSLERLFRHASEDKLDDGFPRPISKALGDSYGAWFPRLRRVRRKTVHGPTGTCTVDSKTATLRYTHHNFESAKPDVAIDDVVKELEALHTNVKALHEDVFGHLYAMLDAQEKCVPCGFYQGRLYERFVTPEIGLTMDSGRCCSLRWFEQDSETLCPLAPGCAAYVRAKDAQGEA